ncbi:MAG: orotidine-5'-phosphate decarboxylase [Patescibacteria group bacterium]
MGLDSEFKKIPKAAHKSDNESPLSVANTIVAFNLAIIEATKDLVCAYKPNIAFYEGYGDEGIEALRRTFSMIRVAAPDVPTILDAKRGDIGNTNKGYVAAAFEFFQADGVTVNPYLGAEALKPFLEMKDKGIIVLCRTSNKGADEFQNLTVHVGGSILSLYEYVANQVSRPWNKNNNCAIVVGATFPRELARARLIVGDLPILIPGVGFQQKDIPVEQQVEQVVTAGQDSHGQGMIINSSRGIIFASSGDDFAEAARRETLKLHELINNFRKVG